MEKSLKLEKLCLGVCYYPEHWDRSLWEDDLARMKEHGICFVRVGEFAWSIFEPVEGEFNFALFDAFLALAQANGMKVILGTPTATPPVWLTEKYPETLNARMDGVLYRHGMRRHYTYNSPKYRELCARIVQKLAEHYGAHPAVAGWQIDNELNCETDVFYSQADHEAFREYLKHKFKTLGELNEAMGTVFWNQTYTTWEQVHLTRPTVHPANNPHLSLEEKRFFSESTISFCKMQADILRKYCDPGQFVTTNGLFGHLDSHGMTEQALDFITYDSYPNFAFDQDRGQPGPDDLLDRNTSFSLSVVRSISPNFGIMEQQSGGGGWDSRIRQPMPKPGQMRLWTMQSVAHGADAVSYFRWRTSPFGTEIYWHGLNDYANLPNRRLRELKRVKEDFDKLGQIAGSRFRASFALLRDYENEWDGEQDQWHGPLRRQSEQGWFWASQVCHAPMDVVTLRPGKMSLQALARYPLLVYPHAAILREETAALLEEYVEQGGVLVMGARTGYKDSFGRCPMRPMPGSAAGLCGVRVSDYTRLTGGEWQEAQWGGERLPAPMFNDILEPAGGARVLARFCGGYYAGQPALVEHPLGKGKALYFGAGFCGETAAAFLRKLGFAEPYKELFTLPEQVELTVREKDGKCYYFLLNYASETQKIRLGAPMAELLSGGGLPQEETLEAFGVRVFTKEVQSGI